MLEPLTPFELQALGLSLKVAAVALIVVLPLGLGLGLLLARGRFPGRWLVEALVNLPLVLPPVVTGLVLLVVFGATGPVGRLLNDLFGVTLAFHWTGAALAAALMALPLVVRPLRLAFESIDQGLEDAAAVLGAPPAAVFLRVTLPLAAPGLVAAAFLGFARAFGEFGATVTFAGSIPGETQTLPVAIYAALQRAQGDQAAVRLALIAVAVSILAVIGSELCNRQLQRARSE
ncbi:molybdate ABC transporter permease subunit [Brevundimonas vitis]|jgi:molybdate transport system permease protein|uniref:Molybdenum transport system permease n=1 Tax=Brevundimonas vitisensis TaxID=2800818 RepID=A0ABX7BKL6_9CAUL|nr:molybdate ABC transporter permease subunit [Brevundimonas vitisensis]QQQ18114.1 molybdate ABC transporter permease subunit [Brevundimonas vitisensis]